MLAPRGPDVLARTEVTSNAVRACAPRAAMQTMSTIASCSCRVSMSGRIRGACYRIVLHAILEVRAACVTRARRFTMRRAQPLDASVRAADDGDHRPDASRGCELALRGQARWLP